MIIKEKILKCFCFISMFVFFSSVVFASEIAKPTSQKILLNSKEVKCEVYNINGSNYFKLRDVAAILTGTASQFSIEYDGNIHITTNNEYVFVGNELAEGKQEDQIANETSSTIYINGIEVFPFTYNINDNNYFGIRYLGNELGFGVNYDQFTNTVLLTAGELEKFDAEAIESGDSDRKGDKKFETYKNKIEDAQVIIKDLYNKIKKEVGSSRSKKQIYAYIALNTWITEKNSEELKFAKLDLENLSEKYDIKLPSIEGTLDYGKNVKSDYYLTAEGKIFIYPPYIYNSKEYVTNKVKIEGKKISVGSIDFEVKDIVNSEFFYEIPVFEENDKKVQMITSFNTGLTLDQKEVLEFSLQQYGYPGISLIVNDMDLREDVITADIYCDDEKVIDVERLFPYCEENYANISTEQLYINEEYYNKVLTINFYKNGDLFAKGKIKLIQ